MISLTCCEDVNTQKCKRISRTRLHPCRVSTHVSIYALENLPTDMQISTEPDKLWAAAKGQLISKFPFGVKTSSEKPTKLFLDFLPEILCTFLGASFRLPYSWYYLLSPQEAEKASRKPPGRYKKFQGRNTEIIPLVFWKKFWHQKDILKLTDL